MASGTQHRYVQDMERDKKIVPFKQVIVASALSPFQKEILEL